MPKFEVVSEYTPSGGPQARCWPPVNYEIQ